MEMLLILFIVQVIVESFPVSSSGHVWLVRHFLPPTFLSEKIVSAVDDFAHGPTAFIIALLFIKEWGIPLKHCLKIRNGNPWAKKLLLIIGKIFLFTVCACLVTTAFYGVIRIGLADIELLHSPWVMALGLCCTTVLLFSMLWLPAKKNEALTFKTALLLGAVQGFALLPGISRFASTYVAGRWLKLSARRAFEISFLFEFPLILAAAVKSFVTMPVEVRGLLFGNWTTILLILASTIVGFLGLRIAQVFALREKFWIFGVYMIVPLSVLINYLLGR